MIARSIAPEIHPIDNITLPAPDKVVLDNGIAMYVINGGVCEVCQFTIYGKGGLFEQSKKLQAQITGLMLKRGAVYLSGKEIAERLDYNGAFCNIQTHDHETEIRITCLISKLNQVLPVVFEFVTKPSFPTNELSTLKDQMSAAYAQMRRQTKYNAQCALNENLFGKNHPLAPFVFEGDVENVVAEDLADFHNNYY